MKKIFLLIAVLILIAPLNIFSQQGAAVVRDYVGLLNQTYHPGVVSFFEKIKDDLTRQREGDAVKIIDIFLSGGFGSGFLFSERGNFYVITNNHVIAQSHTLSITFERVDGTTRKIENLRIIATDEELDLALLALPAGERPFAASGLTFLNRAVNEGEDVFSAGFPGLGATPVWQFARGMVSNASARFPKSILDNTMMGPFIQHTAQIDSGNSGGPLLIAQQGAPSGYVVAGVNTLKAANRQAANYAIPISTVRTFITNSLNQRPETFRGALDERLEKFVEGLGANRAVYPHISEFLSSACIGENAEYAMDQMFYKGSATLRRAFVQKCEESIVGAMGVAVAWTIEDSIRGGTGAIRASIKEVTGSGEEYTVVFTINNRDVSSVWVREYGNWRIRSFGTVAAGEQTVPDRTQNQRQSRTQREVKPNLRLESDFHVEAGYALLFDKAPGAIYASLDFGNFGFNFYYADSEFWSGTFFIQHRWEVPAGDFGFMPYARMGINYCSDKEYEAYQGKTWGALGFPVSLMVQAGLKVTTTYVPGLFIGAAFQYNIFGMYDAGFKNPMKMGLAFTVGYAF
ncbi:MAG: trypsin-like peptidase domain-containing protein [Treponema sp.]|nr:trypsin-like peptidase domain-containing protein [Treponema sp.]